MTKNSQRIVEQIDLGITGQLTPIGVIEAINKLPTYTMTCQVASMSAEMIRVRIDVFVK